MAAQWTKAENLMIYAFMTKYPNLTDHDIENLILNNPTISTTFFPDRKNAGTIKQHVELLRRPEHNNRLFVPDHKNRDVQVNVIGHDDFN
ncbi:hypothetical protein [Paenibacillus anseongense]|uniref:hypothetical protein n=1 Tax=Paenibacillus anseongense TaxID=2682845 RepID=UPI002DB6D47B|nr:hypothetical protein [Paenibacillus anseongense]MEC0265123.1 hypothetical protein [Paenibacillus anseongense]